MAEIDDLIPCIKFSPFFFDLSISSKIGDDSCTTMAEESATMKSEHVNGQGELSEASWFDTNGVFLENEILLTVERFKSSNHALTLN